MFPSKELGTHKLKKLLTANQIASQFQHKSVRGKPEERKAGPDASQQVGGKNADRGVI